MKVTFGTEHILLPCPLSYEDALTAVKEHFPQLSGNRKLAFQTNKLKICEGDEMVRITAGAWDAAIKELDSLEVIELSNSSSGTMKHHASPPTYTQ